MRRSIKCDYQRRSRSLCFDFDLRGRAFENISEPGNGRGFSNRFGLAVDQLVDAHQQAAGADLKNDFSRLIADHRIGGVYDGVDDRERVYKSVDRKLGACGGR